MVANKNAVKQARVKKRRCARNFSALRCEFVVRLCTCSDLVVKRIKRQRFCTFGWEFVPLVLLLLFKPHPPNARPVNLMPEERREHASETLALCQCQGTAWRSHTRRRRNSWTMPGLPRKTLAETEVHELRERWQSTWNMSPPCATAGDPRRVCDSDASDDRRDCDASKPEETPMRCSRKRVRCRGSWRRQLPLERNATRPWRDS